MKIEIINVGQVITEMSKAGKPYKVFELVYRNHDFDGKVETKKINEYSKVAFSALSTAKGGEFYDVQREKDAAGYWNWIAINAGTAVMEQTKQTAIDATPGKKVVGSNYETPEEREAYRQRSFRSYAVQQAISALKTDKAPVHLDAVLDLAGQIEKWVTRRDVMAEIVDMKDDIPQ